MQQLPAQLTASFERRLVQATLSPFLIPFPLNLLILILILISIPGFIGVNPWLNGVFNNNSQNRHFVRKIPVRGLLIYIENNNSAAGGRQSGLAAHTALKNRKNDENTVTKSSKSPLARGEPAHNLPTKAAPAKSSSRSTLLRQSPNQINPITLNYSYERQWAPLNFFS